MAGGGPPYCQAVVVRDTDLLREDVTSFGSFEEVLAFLRMTRDWFADRLAEIRAAEDVVDEVPIGGFGVQLQNRWGSRLEVGVGRDVWFLMMRHPQPARCYSDRPPIEGRLAFCLDGWHLTELGHDQLVSQAACIEALYRWLEMGEFPDF